MLRWPKPTDVEAAVQEWARRERERRPDLLRIGYFGSYARGDAGVGSDLDVIAVVRDTKVPFERRALDWDLGPLPVPAEVLVYTQAEWDGLLEAGGRFAREVEREAVWL